MAQCKKCNGTGYIKGYSHIKGGVCFSCKGKHNEKNNELDNSGIYKFTWTNKNGIRKEIGQVFKHNGNDFEVIEMIKDDEHYGMVEQKMRVKQIQY